MSGVQSSVGLVSGIDYTSLVNELIAIDSIPMNRLQNRTDILVQQRDALEQLNVLMMASTYTINALNRPQPFNRIDPTSSNADILKAARSSDKLSPGAYTFTPVRTAQSQQTIAGGVTSATEALGKTGTITIGKGWSLDKDVALSEINGGAGFTKGQMRITDGTGARATVDLRNATTMNDVVEAINGMTSVDVFAEIIEDRLVLTDMSGVDPADSKFVVQDVSGGSTAASLGLANKRVDPSTGLVIGDSVYRLGENTRLSSLNDGLGLVTDDVVADLAVTCRDGSRVTIDFLKRSTTEEIEAGAPEIHKELTLGDLMETINNSTDANGVAGKIKASISSDGKRLVLTDTTSKMIANPDYDAVAGPSETNPEQIADPDAKTIISQPSKNPVLKSLGFGSGDTAESTDGTFTSRFLIGGLDSPLMSNLNGGNGMAAAVAGGIEVQDRAGNKAMIEFTQAEIDSMQTVEDAVYLVNLKLATVERDGSTPENPLHGVGIEVRMNETKTGFQLVDTTGANDANLIFRDKVTETISTVENPDTGEEEEVVTGTVDPKIASSLGFNTNSSSSTVDGSSLNKQLVSYNTKLSELNGGRGVTLPGAQISITNSAGRTETFAFDSNRHKTLGDVIEEINNNAIGVTVRINDKGDGIMIEDRTNGAGSLTVVDRNSSSKFAETLGIAGTAPQDSKVDGVLRLDASQAKSIEIEATDTLEDIQRKINESGGNFSATIVTDGSDTPYRLSISGASTGKDGAMNIDLSALGLKTETMTEARDAELIYGDSTSGSGVTLYSSTNNFKDVVSGLDLTIGAVPDPPTSVTVTCEKNAIDIVASLETFVTNYNRFKEVLNEVTYFEVGDDGVSGKLLYNNSVARTMDRELIDMVQKQVYGISGINSLASLGVTVRRSLGDGGQLTQTGTLNWDRTVFDAAYAQNPEGVEEFFYNTITEIGEDGKENEVNTAWAQQFMTAVEKTTGDTAGNVMGKIYYEREAMQSKIEQNTDRVEYMKARLDVKREQMLKKFYAMEQTLARMQSDMNSVSNIATNWAQNLGNTGMGGYGTGTYA